MTDKVLKSYVNDHQIEILIHQHITFHFPIPLILKLKLNLLRSEFLRNEVNQRSN